ncbi:MAG: DUF892 family protein [Hyphomicrobium sp.]|uniref:DUF892 family protein n=1 Tax=Hyphomicrobium sp. TaxID=82 RepID=UPI003D12A7D0
MSIQSLGDLFQHELREAHAAERYAHDAIPRLAAAAGAAPSAVDAYLVQARKRLKSLEDAPVIAVLLRDSGTPRSMEGAVLEAERLIGAVAEPGTRIAALSGAMERMKQDLLTRYATLASWAMTLGKATEAKVLLTAIDEELHAAVVQARPGAGPNKGERGGGMGDRLTALLEPKT